MGELRALADQYGLEPDGDGYQEMEKGLGNGPW